MTTDDGKRLRALRELAGYSQADLAALLNERQGVTSWLQTSVAKIEAGERTITLSLLRSYQGIFGEVAVSSVLGLPVLAVADGHVRVTRARTTSVGAVEDDPALLRNALMHADAMRRTSLRLRRNQMVLELADLDEELRELDEKLDGNGQEED